MVLKICHEIYDGLHIDDLKKIANRLGIIPGVDKETLCNQIAQVLSKPLKEIISESDEERLHSALIDIFVKKVDCPIGFDQSGILNDIYEIDLIIEFVNRDPVFAKQLLDNKVFRFLEEYTTSTARAQGEIKNRVTQLLSQICHDFTSKYAPTTSWMENQILYIDSLSKQNHQFVSFYSRYGDEIVNSYIRNGFKLDAKAKSMLKSHGKSAVNEDLYIDQFYHSLQRIILSAPPLDKDIKVFRGTKRHPSKYTGHEDIYRLSGFVSTTLSSVVALDFSLDENSGDYTHISRVLLPKGSRCLMMYGTSDLWEQEILLPDKTTFYVINEYVDEKYLTSNIGFITIDAVDDVIAITH